ncbi:unnamed protein product, partial [Clonostachys rosea f. rosea IK726]
MLGYAGTDSPCSVTHWARKELAADMADLIGQLVPRGEQVIVGGHDWGAGLTYKVALWHPELVKAFFAIAIPYIPLWLGPTKEWVDMLDLVENGTFPTMGYQLQFRDEALERNVTSLTQIRTFLNGVYGGTTLDGKGAFSPQNGVDFDILEVSYQWHAGSIQLVPDQKDGLGGRVAVPQEWLNQVQDARSLHARD